MPEWDVAILGGGLAGLSVAVRLAAEPGRPALRVLVIEPRTSYGRDRTWCSWRLAPHPFEDAVAASWTCWEVFRPRPGGGSDRIVQRAPALPYDMVPADRLYGLALARLAAAPNVELRLGSSALSLEEREDVVRVETEAGPISARYVLDGRPARPSPDAIAQIFLGQEVRAARPIFDPGCVTLMDFGVEALPGAVRFLYVLPLSTTEALVEDTWLAPPAMKLPDHRRAIRSYLSARFGLESYEVTFEESGAIPMDPDLQAPATAGRIVPIGTRAGAVKPSSGYAFGAIQRMADAVAGDLLAGRAPRPFQPRTPLACWMDSVFLRAMRDRPEKAPVIFGSLFQRCAPAPLLRFLNDVGSPADTARVIAATPKVVMIRAALG